MGLDGRVAIITGASSGIGREIAVELGCHGAHVVVNYIGDAGEAIRTTRRIRSAMRVEADVSDRSAVARLAWKTVQRYGRIDILVNNAAILLPNDEAWLRDDLYDMMYEINVQGAINCIEAAAPVMQTHRHGRIINIASMRGIREDEKNKEYARTKRALLHKTRDYAAKLAPHITVNAVSPGIIDAPMAKDPRASDERLRTGSLAQRIGRPQEVALAVSFLADDNAGYITGQNIIVDGGYLQKMGLEENT